MKNVKHSPNRLVFAAFVAAVASLFAACSKEPEGVGLPGSGQAAATQVEQAFANSKDAQAKAETEKLADALAQENYQKAFDAMMHLRKREAENLQQVIAIENADRRLQADILRGVERGDPEAIRMWNMMKRTRGD